MKRKLITFVLLAIACGVSVTSLYTFQRENIEKNREDFSLKTIKQLVNQEDFDLVPVNATKYIIYDQNIYSGTVFQSISLSGYNGEIVLWIATDSEGYIRGVRVVKHRETAGIGDLIDIEVSEWINQFIGMSLQNDWTYENSDIDHVAGATVTTRAVAQAIFDGLTLESQ